MLALFSLYRIAQSHARLGLFPLCACLTTGALLALTGPFAYERYYGSRLVGTYQGIGLCDLRTVRDAPEPFVEWTCRALDLIQTHDPRRFRRVLRYLKYIAAAELISNGCYDSVAEACMVDMCGADFDTHPEWYSCCYAGLLVQEATHGLLYARGILYTPRNRLRIERLCRREERRYLGRACPGWAADMRGDINESWLRRYWDRRSYREMWKRRMERVRQEGRAAKQGSGSRRSAND